VGGQTEYCLTACTLYCFTACSSLIFIQSRHHGTGRGNDPQLHGQQSTKRGMERSTMVNGNGNSYGPWSPFWMELESDRPWSPFWMELEWELKVATSK
jgi:hypothetical protein